MKATNPPRETLSSLNYRHADETPTTTPPAMKDFANAALSLLGGQGQKTADDLWELSLQTKDGAQIDISCTGPDLPATIPDDRAHPSVIPFERPWVATYRLTVNAPLVVFDIAWRPDEPLRIMNFSRGNWEDELVSLAG